MDYFEEIIIFIESGNLEEALVTCEAWCNSEPKSAKAKYNRGTLLHQLGDNLEAEIYLRECILIDPKHAHGLSNLGSVLCCQQKFAEATQFFEQALEHCEEAVKPKILVRLGDCLLKQKRYNDAWNLLPILYEIDEERAQSLEGEIMRRIIPGEKESLLKKVTNFFRR